MFGGTKITEQVDRNIKDAFSAMLMTQLYPSPFLFIRPFGSFTKFGSVEGIIGSDEKGITIHESITSMGVTSELITAADADSIQNYMSEKDLQLQDNALSILNEYIGQDFSFVISWISDIDKYKEDKRIHRNYGMYPGDMIGVFVTFPTEKMYFPLKPTSVYGSLRVPATIYVMDYVKPELYAGIESASQTEYFYKKRHNPSQKHIDFFFNKNRINDLRFTKIRIDTPSKYLTQDLWLNPGAPLRIRIADIMNKLTLLYGLFFFILISCIASLLAGFVMFRKEVSNKHMLLFGLFNFLSLIGFSIAVYFKNIKQIPKNIKDYISKYELKLLNDPKKKYFITIWIFSALFVIWLIIGRFIDSDAVGILMFPPTMLAFFIFCFFLSKEKLLKKYDEYFSNRDIELKIVDIKKLGFLLIFNIVVSYVLINIFSRNKFLGQIIGFGRQHLRYYTLYTESLAYLIMLFVFLISIIILLFLDRFFKKRYKTKGLFIIQKDPRKIGFVIVFSVFFTILALLSSYIMRFIF